MVNSYITAFSSSKPQSSDASSASAGVVPIGGTGPQPAPESSASTPAGPPPGSAPEASGLRGPEPEAVTPPRPEAAPQEEAARPTAATEAPTAVLDVEVGPSPAEPAVEGAAATVEAAAPEAAEVPETLAPEAAEVVSTATPPAQEEEPEELEAGIRREWEKLEAERLRLSDWENRLGDCIKSVTTRYADERAKFMQGHELLQEQLAATWREKHATERELAAELKVQVAADREQTTLELADQAKKVVAATKAQETTLAKLAAAAAKREERLAAREAEEEHEAALQEKEAKVEELLAERSASIGQITRWVGAVNPLLEALRANPIRVTEAPSPLGAALQVLDSTAERLRDVEASIQDLLEIEGRAVARGMAEYILTSFRSHDPAIQLTPILVGPLRATAAAVQEGVREVADMVVARIRRRPEPA
ncbi:uncharacterized protein LOC112900543 [Panicum hallii]|uniref:uncharacterized protein LOC112900543 n=1 Tax=Panicum hallii TaxID=206008 RepID=UPI000DF4EE2B|nr:uncharacterized protein LOC112900543 [Panicum hallii]